MKPWWEEEPAKKWWFEIEPRSAQHGGALILGIESGLEKGQTPSSPDSWFTGLWTSTENSPSRYLFQRTGERIRVKYRSRVGTYFRLFAQPLDGPQPSEFELSIQCTNWLLQQKPHPTDTTDAEIAAGAPALLRALNVLRPRVILLMGTRLFNVMAFPEVREQFEAVFGAHLRSELVQSKPIGAKRACSFGFARFENTTVLAFPHPTGSRASNRHLAEMPEEMKDLFKNTLTGSGT